MMTLKSKGFFRYFPLFAFPLFIVVGLIGTINAFNDGQVFAQLFMLVWMGILFYNIYKFIKMVIKIDILENGDIILKTITGKDYQMNSKEFKSIKVNNGITEFVTQSGKFVSMGNFDGFSEFVVTIKKTNSDLITKGC